MTTASTVTGSSTNGAASPADSGITLLDYARVFAEEGMAVFPCHSIVPGTGRCTCGDAACKSPGKHPKTANGVLDATDDIAQITAWFAGAHDTNIGIATGEKSGLVVVDIDSHKGAEPQKLVGDTGVDATAFSTLKVQTGGGMHLYYRLPKGVSVRNSTSKLAPYVDIRGEGGYVIAPGSKHASGKPYVFLDSEADMLEFPAEWVKRLNSRQPAPAAANGNGNGNGAAPGFVVPPPSEGLKVPQLIDHGSRNATLIKLAGLLRHHGFAEDAIFSALWSENNRICKPPLDQKEVHQIAHSAGRYAPQTPLGPVSEDEAASLRSQLTTLNAFSLSDLFSIKTAKKEVLAFHIGKKDIGCINAPTNGGKTTLLRNVVLCMTAGRPFMPFYAGGRPLKVAYFDFESDAQEMGEDLKKMSAIFTDEEKKIQAANFIAIPKGLVNGDVFQFNTHEKWAADLIKANGVDFVVIDNISAAYDLNDENSNAEVKQKIIKPLQKIALLCDCACLFAHHYGKPKSSGPHSGANVHAARGASNLQALAKSVFNLSGELSSGMPLSVECVKRKTDGGQVYTETFRLDDDRWLKLAKIVAPPKPKPLIIQVKDFVFGFSAASPVSTQEIEKNFEPSQRSQVHDALRKLSDDGVIYKPGRGKYSALPAAVDGDDQTDENAWYR